MSLCSKEVISYNEKRRFKAYQFDDTKSNESNAKKYPSNFIKTSRYTILTFAPMSLLLQFQRFANIYFLITAVLQCISIISPLSPAVAVAPLIFVLAVSMAREGYEDYQRHKSDSEQNYNTKSKRVLADRQDESVSWADIHVGDILHIFQDEIFPADLLVLGSNIEGMCYIETGALDGEKNLKPKNALIDTADYFSTGMGDILDLAASNSFVSKHTQFSLTISANSPDQDPNNFAGSISFSRIDQPSKNGAIRDIPADQNQFLPRGAFLRNTESIYAVVVYTGMDTKIMRNAEEPKAKSSDMESKMNKFILCILIFQLLCAFIMSSCSFYWLNENFDIFPYLYLHKSDLSASTQSVLIYFSYFILFNTMIPISLIVSLEMVKVLQSYFITNDAAMYSAHNDKWPRVLTSTINEELGQIEYVFSDKTGTLTQNQMQFKMAIIGTTLYGEAAAKAPPKQVKSEPPPPPPGSEKPAAPQQHQLSKFVFEDQNLSALLAGTDSAINYQVNLNLKSQDGQASLALPTQFDLTREYLQVLGLSHECIVEKNKDPNDKELYFQGPSPDEITLVDAAHHLGFSFTGKTSNKLLMRVNVGGTVKPKEVIKINLFEFSSARKRNTLILEDNGVFKMYIKGADNVVKERLDMKIQQPFLSNADKKLTEFSVVGLRTLLIGMKVMSKAEVDNFVNKYNALSNSPNRKQDLENLADEVERGFFLLGATAVEDKLQDNVPETINDLLRANIKVWMLTGDKLETAENIAKSCKLILEDFELLVMSDKNPNVIRKEMTDVLWRKFKKLKESKVRKCFLVEGDCLKVIFQEGNEDIKKKFVQITKDCESVVCCRVSPVQKAQVVRSIREGLNKITLAIGDGANDVNMIQAAHIGCGIYGNEGMRAVQSSDFAFGQFKCLWRLIFVHGRWSYIRISEMIVYFFYKNMIFTIPQLFFAFFSGFSAMSIFDDLFISLYNLVFTALPLIIRAIFDQDVNPHYLNLKKNIVDPMNEQEIARIEKLVSKRKSYIQDRLPQLYYIGQQQQLFSTRIFLEWIIQGFIHGLFIFFVCYWSIGNHIYEDDGFTSDQWSFSLIIYTSVVLIADIKLAMNTRYWTSITYIAFYATSIGLYIVAFFVAGKLNSSYVLDTPNYIVTTPHFYLVIFLIVVGIFGLDMAVFSVKELFLNKTKEKALRKLMKQQPSKSTEKNKWLFAYSDIDQESNLNSFMDKQNAEDTVSMMSSVDLHNLQQQQQQQQIQQQQNQTNQRQSQENIVQPSEKTGLLLGNPSTGAAHQSKKATGAAAAAATAAAPHELNSQPVFLQGQTGKGIQNQIIDTDIFSLLQYTAAVRASEHTLPLPPPPLPSPLQMITQQQQHESTQLCTSPTALSFNYKQQHAHAAGQLLYFLPENEYDGCDFEDEDGYQKQLPRLSLPSKLTPSATATTPGKSFLSPMQNQQQLLQFSALTPSILRGSDITETSFFRSLNPSRLEFSRIHFLPGDSSPVASEKYHQELSIASQEIHSARSDTPIPKYEQHQLISYNGSAADCKARTFEGQKGIVAVAGSEIEESQSENMTDTAEFDCVIVDSNQGGGGKCGGSGGGVKYGDDDNSGLKAYPKGKLANPKEGQNRRTIHSSNFNLSFMQLYSNNLMHPNNIGGAIDDDFNKVQQGGGGNKRQPDQKKQNEIDIENPQHYKKPSRPKNQNY